MPIISELRDDIKKIH